jgi:hypothetical protein
MVEYCTAARSGDKVERVYKAKEGASLRGSHLTYVRRFEQLQAALTGHEFLLNPERVTLFANHAYVSALPLSPLPI